MKTVGISNHLTTTGDMVQGKKFIIGMTLKFGLVEVIILNKNNS